MQCWVFASNIATATDAGSGHLSMNNALFFVSATLTIKIMYFHLKTVNIFTLDYEKWKFCFKLLLTRAKF